jgi:hypothetical protein
MRPVIPEKPTTLRFLVAVFRFTSFFFCANYALKFLGMLAFSFGGARGKLGPEPAWCVPECVRHIRWLSVLVRPLQLHMSPTQPV